MRTRLTVDVQVNSRPTVDLVALCWNCDSAEGPASASIRALASACGRRDERAPGRLPERCAKSWPSSLVGMRWLRVPGLLRIRIEMNPTLSLGCRVQPRESESNGSYFAG